MRTAGEELRRASPATPEAERAVSQAAHAGARAVADAHTQQWSAPLPRCVHARSPLRRSLPCLPDALLTHAVGWRLLDSQRVADGRKAAKTAKASRAVVAAGRGREADEAAAAATAAAAPEGDRPKA
eukprot:7199777-Prymnesium_polylepis.2